MLGCAPHARAPPLLSRTQVQEKGTYDLLAPLALLFYSTVLCVSAWMGQPGGGGGGKGRTASPGAGGRAVTAQRIKAQWEELSNNDTADGCQPSDGFRWPFERPPVTPHGHHPAGTIWGPMEGMQSQPGHSHREILQRDVVTTSFCPPGGQFPQCGHPLFTRPVAPDDSMYIESIHFKRINICLSWGFLRRFSPEDHSMAAVTPFRMTSKGTAFRIW